MVFTLSPRGARVEVGIQSTGGLDPVYVALPEDAFIPDMESIQQAMRNPEGKFILPSVPPGSYRLFSLDAATWPLLFNPVALMEKYRALAAVITVAEGDRKSVVVPATKIPE